MKVIFKSHDSIQSSRSQFKRDLAYVFEMHSTNPSFNMSKTCEELLLSRASLYRKIQKHYNSTFTELLMEHRVECAKKCLDLGMLISDVAYNVGYSDPSYFVKIFRRKIGVTPAQYRSKIKSSLSC